MRKRRLPFFIISLLAAAAAAASTLLTWWHGATPAHTDFIQLISTDVIDATDWLLMSVAMVLFVGAGVVLLGGILGSKLVGFIGLAINVAVVVLWALMTRLQVWPLDLGQFQTGAWLIAASILLSVISLFIRRHHKGKR
jgi:hypothetical protein